MTVQLTRRSTLIATGAIALAGCQSAVDREAQNDEAASSVAPVEGGTLVIAQSSDAQPNNVLAGRAGNSGWASSVFETLTVRDEEGEPQSLLATEWALAEDNLSLELTLREGVTFHTGRSMTAEDVKFSLEHLAESASQVSFIVEQFDAIEVTSPSTLTITFASPITNIFDLLEYTFILDQETVAGLDDGSEIIGTGPFLCTDWSPGSGMTFERNDDYWGEQPHLDGIEIAVIPDSTAMLNAVRSGRAHVAIGMSSQDIQQLAQDSAYRITTSVGAGSVYPLGVSVDEAPFDNVEVRRAVQQAIDRQRIAEQIFGEAATPTALFWGDDVQGDLSDLVDAYTYAPEAATTAIDAAGATGAAVEISVISIPDNASVAEIVRNNLESVGLAPKIAIVETQDFGPRQIAGDLGAAFLPLHGLNGLGPHSLLSTLPSLRKGNSSHFWSDEYEILREKLGTADETDAPAALRELTEYLVDQAFTANIVRVDAQYVESAAVHDLRWSSRGYAGTSACFISE